MIKYTSHLITPPYDLNNELEKRQIIVLNYCPIESSQRIKDFHSEIEIKLQEVQPSIEYINLVIESQIAFLLFTNTIENLDNTFITRHYKNRLTLINNERPTLNFSKVEDLSLSHKSIWLGFYGSLANLAINLNDADLSYISFSELSFRTINLLFNRFTKVNGNRYGNYDLRLWNSTIDNITTISSDLDERYDFELYNSVKQLFYSESLISDVIYNLDFLAKWIPDLIKWYFNSFNNNNYEVPIEPSEGTNEYKAYSILSSIAKLVVNAGLDRTYEENELSYNFIHQSLSTNWINVYAEIINLRKQFLYDPNLSRSTQLDILAIAFYQTINSESESNLSLANSFLIEYLTPPGGYNLLLISIASLLLNRAYIISHPSVIGSNLASIKFNELSSPRSSLIPSDEDLSSMILRAGRVNEIVLRTNKLTFLAGITLRKSNLDHIQLLGNNLCHISGFKDDSPIRFFQL